MRQNLARADSAADERTVMVVEDEVLIRVLMCDLLREAGLRVIEAHNADDAIRHLAADNTVSLVFSDVRMPGSMNGLDLVRRIATDFPHIRTALTSGHLSPDDVPAETLFFSKPYFFDEVAGRLAELADQEPAA